jgi:putative hemolysin
MESEVHEAFGNVIDRGVGDVVDGARIKDTLVSDESLSARVEDGVEVAEFFSDVVGIEDSDCRGFFETGFPMVAKYIQQMVAMEALPQGAAATAPCLPPP